MDERLIRIRENERKSHTEIYMNEKLYNTNSWLQKPIKTVQEISSLFNISFAMFIASSIESAGIICISSTRESGILER